MIVYFDSSALVKLLISEDGSDLASQLWDACDAAAVSRLGQVEVAAALAAARRAHRLDDAAYTLARSLWIAFASSLYWVEVSSVIAQQASSFVELHALKGADAVHLASGLALGGDAVLFATWDHRLHMAATAEGLGVIAEGLD